MRDDNTTLRSTDGRTMALAGVTAHGHLRGLLFELGVEQRWRNPTDTNIEAVYTFPLPFDAVLLDLSIEIGGRVLSAAVVEKRASERRYEEAIDAGDSAILLERASDGLYTLNLGNLMAGESTVVRYRYAQLLAFAHGSVRLAVPTVIAPRYGDAARAGLAPQQIPGTDLSAVYPFALSVDLTGEIASATLSSPSHAIATEPLADGVRVSIARTAFLDRDFVLELGGLAGRTLAAVARDGEGCVALASFCAPTPRDADERPLRVKLLVDCSGSMNGDSIDAARRALHRVLAGLEPADRFSYSRFGTGVVHETDGMLAGDAAGVRAAAERLARMDADLGGTEMAAALRAVFAIANHAPADVLVITDGETWDAQGLVDAARAAGQRVFAVGIGSAPAEGVLRRLAESSGGACEFVAPNEDAEGAIVRMFARLRAPRIDRAEIAWPVAPAWTAPLPSGLFGGETIHAFAGFASAPSGTATLTLSPRGEGETLHASATLPAAVDDGRTLARMAAARRYASLPEPERLALALDYALVTPLTNLLVVHERAAGEKAADLPQIAKVAQMHAAGWGGVGSVLSPACSIAFSALDAPDHSGLPLGGEREAFAPFDALLPLLLEDKSRALPGRDPGAAAGEFAPESAAARSAAIADFLTAVERAGIVDRASTLDGLAETGLPADLLRYAAGLIAEGHDERDVVRALLEALGALVDDGVVAATVSRQFLRALRHRFADAADARALRDAVNARLRGIEVAAHAG